MDSIQVYHILSNIKKTWPYAVRLQHKVGHNIFAMSVVQVTLKFSRQQLNYKHRIVSVFSTSQFYNLSILIKFHVHILVFYRFYTIAADPLTL